MSETLNFITLAPYVSNCAQYGSWSLARASRLILQLSPLFLHQEATDIIHLFKLDSNADLMSRRPARWWNIVDMLGATTPLVQLIQQGFTRHLWHRGCLIHDKGAHKRSQRGRGLWRDRACDRCSRFVWVVLSISRIRVKGDDFIILQLGGLITERH